MKTQLLQMEILTLSQVSKISYISGSQFLISCRIWMKCNRLIWMRVGNQIIFLMQSSNS